MTEFTKIANEVKNTEMMSKYTFENPDKPTCRYPNVLIINPKMFPREVIRIFELEF